MNFTCIRVQDEREMILKFIELLTKHRPDIISGFNDNSFDW